MASSYSVKYCDSTSILIVNSRGQIKLLYTPFKVQCIENAGRFKKGSFVFVEEVTAGERD